MFERITSAGIALLLAASPAVGQTAGFQRQTPAVATDSVKPVGRQGRVSRESLSIAACKARAARDGAATFKEMRLLGRHTFLVTGTIMPARRTSGQRIYSCTVRGEGEILAFKTSPAR